LAKNRLFGLLPDHREGATHISGFLVISDFSGFGFGVGLLAASDFAPRSPIFLEPSSRHGRCAIFVQHLTCQSTHRVPPLVGRLSLLLSLFGRAYGAGVTTVEFEPGLVRDIHEFFERLIPEQRDYFHHATWGDDNGSSHLRAALLKPSLTIPFRDGQFMTGTWQQIVLIDFDTRPRQRSIIFQFIGE